MAKKIIADMANDQVRVGILEDGRLMEYHVENDLDKSVAGNIYKGKVENVLPGMQAAFVDIGLEKNAFLYVGDLTMEGLLKQGKNKNINIKNLSINDVLTTGQEVLVQVVKEPVGTKGARVTMNITLPGRYLVLMPTLNYVGISRKIENENERKRLKTLAEKTRPRDMGVIVRTVAEDIGEEELETDAKYLTALWKSIWKKQEKIKGPKLVYRDKDLINRVIRDIFTQDVQGFYVNSPKARDRIVETVSVISEDLSKRVHLYRGSKEIFRYFNIENEVTKALGRKVWLKSGGYLVIDHTEALTVIDVNTGRFVGNKNLEDTVFKTNVEAAKEIARQLRLRDIGGIIIIDFIDLSKKSNEKQVINILTESVKRDRTKVNILGMTKLGLVEMTRKKVNQSLDEILEKTCPYCEGKGRIISESTMAKRVERKLFELFKRQRGEAVLVEVNPTVAAVLIGVGGNRLKQLEQKSKKYIFIKGRDDLNMEEIKIRAVGSRAKLKMLAMPVREGQILEVVIDEVHTTNPNNGISRLDGYIIDINYGAKFLGEKVKIKITRAFRTYAKANLI